MNDFIKAVCCFLIIIVSPAGFAWETLTADLDLTCDQKETVIKCSYRLLDPAAVRNISASSNEESLPVRDKINLPATGRTSAILFVVDTSDPARQNVIDKNIEHIEKILAAGQTHHRFGLASFDKDLRVNAQIGSSQYQIVNAARRLQATGKTTELYRNVIKAIDVIAGVAADRKAIYLFSDGQAEDRAYYHQDVIRAARRAKVTINSLGYPRSIPLSVALQTIRRLSEESGGMFIETDNNFNLPYSFLDAPFTNIDAGGEFAVDLQNVLVRDSPEVSQITLNFETATGNIRAVVPVTNPFHAALPAAAAPAVAAPRETPQTQPIRIVAPVQEPQSIDVWLWYGIPVAFLILIVLTVIILIVTYQQLKLPKTSSGKPAAGTYKPYAYLVAQDDSGLRYPITNTTWRIGRTRDNELSLNDKSVSRRHAEIQRYRNGNFVIYDVDSLNGVFVNSEQVKKKKLEEGDIIEIGDIYLRFTTSSAEFSIEEDTAIQNTRTPLAH